MAGRMSRLLTRVRRRAVGAMILALILLTSLPAAAADKPGSRVLSSSPPGIEIPDDGAKHPRLDSELVRISRSAEAFAAFSEPQSDSRDASVAISVRVAGEPDDVAAALTARGAVVANTGVDVIEAYATPATLEAIAGLPGVLSVRPLDPPIARAVMSQGVALHGVPNWNMSGFTGAGVKVGVIDVGFEGVRSLIGVELPTPIGRCYRSVGNFTSNLADCERNGVHGTAVAETVIDVAPDAALYIANPLSPLDLHDAVAWMAAQGVTVINHSVGWGYEGPGDGTTTRSNGPLAAVDSAVSKGVVWVNAAGNEGLSSWSGSYSDLDSNGFLEFAPAIDANGITVFAGFEITLYIRWDDSWTNASADLDLYLFDGNGNVLARSDSQQSGATGHEPFERIRYTPSQTGMVYAVVYHYGGPAPTWIQMQVLSGETLQYGAPGYSIGNPAESANQGMLAVGAAGWKTPDAIAPYSSQGPTRDGRIKPDVVGIDFADTVSYGPSAFPGTSQAAPHVAGMAVLVKQRYPGYGPVQIAQYLRTNASRSSNPDNTWGYGLALLPVVNPVDPGIAPDYPAFELTWGRTDRPVKDLVISRTWMWGDGPVTTSMWEDYVEAPRGFRSVKYFDKSRMEVTDPDGDATSPWYVTNGLLVMELITGRMQIGDDVFVSRQPARVNVAGDPGVEIGPTYETFLALLDEPAAADGSLLTTRLSRDGTLTDDPALAIYGVTAAHRLTVPGIDHQVATPFWEFMTASGVVYDAFSYRVAPLFENPFYATGFPVTEAYWTTVMVGGVPRDVLVQCFERRCLTYTPANPDGWQVEAGNVGRHYYLWRYNREPSWQGR